MVLSEPNPVPKVLRRGYSSVADDVTLTDPPPPGSIPQLGRRVYLVNVAVFLFIFCLAIEGPLSVQFIYYRLKQHSFNGTADENMTTCLANHSDSKNDKYNKIQATAAEIQIFLAISTGIPSIIACVIFGTLSDRFGRRFLLALPVCGVLVRSVIYGVVNEYDLSLYYLLIGTTADGLCGGFACFLLGAFAGSADVTAGGRRRSFLIAFVEASGTLSLGLGSLCLGFLIDGCGYTIPNVVAAVISALNLGMIIFAVPETHSRKAEQRLTFKEIKILLLRVISFYVKKGGRFKRLRFSICWVAFFLTSVTYIGSASVETLFMKNYPLCWDSISIGYFIGLKSVCQAIAVVGLIKLLQYWFGDIWIGVICAVGKIAAFILQGFATTDVEMYLVAVIGMAAIGVMAMLRSIMSKSTPREELGAMFAGVAVAEATTTMVGGVMFNGIYQATLANMPGLIFFVMAAILGSVVILFGFLHCLIRLEKRDIKSDGERRPLNGKVEFF